MLSLPIHLWMIGSTKVLVDVKEAAKRLCKVGGKLHTTVQNDFVWEAEVFQYVVDIQSCCLICCDCSFTRNDDNCFGDIMINHNKDSIISLGVGKLCDEI